jgi:hypothetical protein
MQQTMQATNAGDARRRTAAGRWKMLAVLLVCAAPVIASYYTYYVIRPEGRTNYGELVEPPRNVAALGVPSLQGRWVMLVVAPGTCDPGCRERLYEIRQVRLTAGKDRDRVARVWVVADDTAPDPALLAQHDGLVLMRTDVDALARQFPATPQTRVSDHIYLIDPLGNLMMRFPKDADPSRMKKDLAKLLRASRVG